MNKERILQLADHLEKPETVEHFNMTTFVSASKAGYIPSEAPIGELINNCGTTACIAGHAHVLFAPMNAWVDIDFPQSCELLGIDDRRAYDLFRHFYIPTKDGKREVTNLDAAKVLRNHVETGEVDWSVCEGYEDADS